MPGDVEMAVCTPCAPQEPGERLLSACEKRDLPGFLAALTDVAVDDPNCAACLHRAAGDPAYVEYLKRLLSAGVDPNTPDKRRKTPLQIAAERNNADSLQAILRDKRTDVAVLDQFGNTALHLVTQGQGNPDVQARCISLLLAHQQVDANKKNRKGHSTVLLAAKKCPLLVVQALLKHPGIDLDHAKFLDGTTARTLIETNFKALEGQLPPPAGEKASSGDDLMRLLYARQDHATRRFCELVKEGVHGDVDHHDGHDTLLQRACADGLAEAASALLSRGADPNKTCPGVKVSRPPLLIACAAGHADVARLLLDDDRTRVSATTEEGDTALIQLIRSWDGLQGGHQKCLNMLLDHHEIDINASNERGETALHYASVTGDRGLVLDLLKVGAYIGGANSLNRLPLTNIPRDVMETHLNDCLTNHQSHFSENYRLEFDYSFLVPPGRKGERQKLLDSKAKDCEIGDSDEVQEDLSSYPETDPLLYMSRKPDLRPLLKHPVLTSFMELKWRRLSLLFRLNIIFYILFVAFITVHILWGNGRNKAGATNTTADDVNPAPHLGNPGFECLQWIPLAKNDSLEEASETPGVDQGSPDLSDARVTFNDSIQVVAIILLAIFVLRELFQFLVSPKRYFSWSNKENYFEILLLVSTSLILFRNDLQPYFSAITILLSWGELVLLVGRHPMLSTYIEMLKTVSWNFLKFLAWYAILIVAFALSFYTLFRDSDDADNFFADPGLSVFKTVVMLTGEFDASDIPFVEFPIVSHAVFVMFVFLIAIVLFNLLNGLAVSDTQAIKDDAELVGYVSRVKLVAYIERMVLGHGKRSSWWPSLLRWPVLARRVTLFSDTVNVAGHVLPNQGAALWVGPRDEKRDSPPGDACSLHCDVIKAAEDALAMKDRPTDMEQIRRSLEVTEARLADMESHFRGVEKLLQELLNSGADKPAEQ